MTQTSRQEGCKKNISATREKCRETTPEIIAIALIVETIGAATTTTTTTITTVVAIMTMQMTSAGAVDAPAMMARTIDSVVNMMKTTKTMTMIAITSAAATTGAATSEERMTMTIVAVMTIVMTIDRENKHTTTETFGAERSLLHLPQEWIRSLQCHGNRRGNNNIIIISSRNNSRTACFRIPRAPNLRKPTISSHRSTTRAVSTQRSNNSRGPERNRRRTI